MSVFDLETFAPSFEDIAYSSAHKMPPSPAHKVQGMRIVKRHSRPARAEQVPATLPNVSLEEQTAPEKDTIDVIRLERDAYSANRRRAKDLSWNQPTASKLMRRQLKPTHHGGGSIIQPGGGFRGN